MSANRIVALALAMWILVVPCEDARGDSCDVVMTCGLVPTTFEDPDWVVASSPHLLTPTACGTSPGCKLNSQWDRVLEPACDEVWYWKFAPQSGSACAFPASLKGGESGTRSIYVRPGQTFQLFSGVGDDVPLGSPMVGPKFITSDFWEPDSSCVPFDPGTIFLPDLPYCLEAHSIKIGGDVEILEVDGEDASNEASHHTNKFRVTDLLIVRRGQTFQVDVKCSNPYSPQCHEISFIAEHDFDGSVTAIDIPAFETTVPVGEWGTTRLDVAVSGQTKIVTMQIQIPPDVAVGEYSFEARIKIASDDDYIDTTEFPDSVVILFNPWESEDDVYLASAAERNEYVLTERGRIWVIDSVLTRQTWLFGQFESDVLDVALGLLEELGSSQRADPILVSRHLSFRANAHNRPGSGVLQGKWPEPIRINPYADGKKPWEWRGSGEIASQFHSSGEPVLYGQCWVFGGLLTSFLRTLGIPARPITNIESAHDADGDKVIDLFWTASGHRDRTLTVDGYWNFHVWVEAWMKRPDRPGHDGWQAVDATPQEPSGAVFQMGPAPVSAVLADAGGQYDTDFVWAEVDADVREYQDDGTGEYVQTALDTTSVGMQIITKAVGSNAAADIAASYKTPESPPLMLGELRDVVVTLTDVPLVEIGSPLVWSMTLANTSPATRTIDVVMTGAVIEYDGTFGEDVASIDTNVVLGAGEVETADLVIEATTYEGWLDLVRTFEVSASATVVETGERFTDIDRTLIDVPGMEIEIVPLPFTNPGETSTCSVQFTNPLSVDLHGAVVTYTVSSPLLVEGELRVEVPLGTIGAGASVSVSRDVLAIELGPQAVSVVLDSDELALIYGSVDLDVVIPADVNGDGMVGFGDLTKVLVDWGPCPAPPAPCPSDVNGDGNVGFGDLTSLFIVWGWTMPV